MAAVNLTPDFSDALLRSESWPMNTVFKTVSTYPEALKALKSRLDSIQRDVFEDTASEWEIPIRDLSTSTGQGVEKCNAHSPASLLEWLGLAFEWKATFTAPESVHLTKKDPKCRFICLYAPHSRAKLKFSREMLTYILTFHQVMPAFIDFLPIFGLQTEPSDLGFSAFREQSNFHDHPSGIVMPQLERSGKHYQICYNLKCVVNKSSSKEDISLDEWSIRQSVIHHQFDVVTGKTLWITIKGNKELQQRFRALTDRNARPQDKSFQTPEDCLRSSLSSHLMFCHWATEDWRFHIQWLEKVVDRQSIMAVYGPSGIGHCHKIYLPQDIQDLQGWEEKVRRGIASLEGNVDVMLALITFYQRLARNKEFPMRRSCGSDITSFIREIESIIADFKMQVRRAEFLTRTISDRRELVVQHLQSQSANRTERLNRNMEQEQIMMLIVTVVTLIYLPATFVSTFFSTDVIKYQDADTPHGNFSKVAMERWLEVTLPLTALTGGIALWARSWMQKRRTAEELDADSHRIGSESGLVGKSFRQLSLLPLYTKKL